MITKLFEIRDRATFIPVLAIKIDHKIKAQSYLLGKAGFFESLNPDAVLILLCEINNGGGKCQAYPYDWLGRTLQVAHDHIVLNWDELKDGAVIDVEFLLGETDARKVSDRIDHD